MASLARAREGGLGPVGLFEADHQASRLISAAVKGHAVRAQITQMHAASVMIVARLRAKRLHRMYRGRREGAVKIQRAMRKVIDQRAFARAVERDRRHTKAIGIVQAFIKAVEMKEAQQLLPLVTDGISLTVDLNRVTSSYRGLKSFLEHATLASSHRFQGVSFEASPLFVETDAGDVTVARELSLGESGRALHTLRMEYTLTDTHMVGGGSHPNNNCAVTSVPTAASVTPAGGAVSASVQDNDVHDRVRAAAGELRVAAVRAIIRRGPATVTPHASSSDACEAPAKRAEQGGVRGMAGSAHQHSSQARRQRLSWATGDTADGRSHALNGVPTASKPQNGRHAPSRSISLPELTAPPGRISDDGAVGSGMVGRRSLTVTSTAPGPHRVPGTASALHHQPSPVAATASATARGQSGETPLSGVPSLPLIGRVHGRQNETSRSAMLLGPTPPPEPLLQKVCDGLGRRLPPIAELSSGLARQRMAREQALSRHFHRQRVGRSGQAWSLAAAFRNKWVPRPVSRSQTAEELVTWQPGR